MVRGCPAILLHGYLIADHRLLCTLQWASDILPRMLPLTKHPHLFARFLFDRRRGELSTMALAPSTPRKQPRVRIKRKCWIHLKGFKSTALEENGTREAANTQPLYWAICDCTGQPLMAQEDVIPNLM